MTARLDRYLSERFRYRSRTQWVGIIEAGRIVVNGRTVRPSQRLRFGDQIEYRPAERRPEPEVDVSIATLHEDANLLAVDKPANLPVHPSGRYFRNTLLSELLVRRGETLDHPGIRIVHRLDRETSGVVLFGKDRESTAALARQFERRQVDKQYLVVVHGVPTEASWEVDAPLGRATESRVRKAVGVVAEGAGVSARTGFELVARGPSHALLRARPFTGRLHQIRVHARHAGFPVVGDKLYGLDEEFFLKLVDGRDLDDADQLRLVLERQGLHAHRLTVKHPATRREVQFTAPFPASLRRGCASLGIALPVDLDDPAADVAP